MRISNLFFSWWLRPGKVWTLVAGGRKRSYFVHVPGGREPQTPLPVVLALHGATMNGPMMAWFSGLNRKADAAGFLAVYPNGTGKHSSFTWNGGNGLPPSNPVDDVAFIDALLDDLLRAYPVDTRQIYATGMSNGAVMAYRLAAELAGRIAAIAPVAGSVGVEVGRPKRPVSVLHFHGTKDEFIPFPGGRGAKSATGTNHRSVEESIRAWVKANGCVETPKTDVLSEGGDGMRVTRQTYGAGRDGAEVVLVVIESGGHTWPGQKSPARMLGPSTLSVSANDLMWEFFQRHRRQSIEKK
jgi:polyhydroxybutyrate depolymerase